MIGVSKGCLQIIKRVQIDDHLSKSIVKWHSIRILDNLNIDLLTITSNYVSSFYLWQIYCALLLSRVICRAHSGYIAFQLLEAVSCSRNIFITEDFQELKFFTSVCSRLILMTFLLFQLSQSSRHIFLVNVKHICSLKNCTEFIYGFTYHMHHFIYF